MAREVKLDDNELILKLKGIIVLFAFRKTITIPYKSILNVDVEDFKIPHGMIRTLGTSIPPSLREGNFMYGGELYFLSYEHNVPLLHLEIEGEKYRHVIFELDCGYHDLLIDLRRKIREAQSLY